MASLSVLNCSFKVRKEASITLLLEQYYFQALSILLISLQHWKSETLTQVSDAL